MSQDTYRHAEALVDTTWLEAHLGDAQVRVFDGTVYLHPVEEGADAPYRVESGRADYEAGHIPGAGFLDLPGELSDPDSRLRFMAPPAEQFARVMGAHGVGDQSRVVLYSRGSMMWATRLWWMLRAFGFDRAAVLDGGFEAWRDEGRAIETGGAAQVPPGTFTPRPRPGLFVDRQAMVAAMQDAGTVTLNALTAELHRGESARYGRPGRIPGSVNVAHVDLVDADSHRFVASAHARARFEAVGARPEKRILAYCGGGIAATLDAFILHQLGYGDLAVYDGSMSEWAKDQTLPMETG
jgi:thiosulfate/3-mercaptopyruvate sulfurtransferase